MRSIFKSKTSQDYLEINRNLILIQSRDGSKAAPSWMLQKP